MRQNRLTLVVGVIVTLVFLLGMTTYEVNEAQVSVVTTFGRATGEVAEPGLHLKWPWPVQDVVTLDRRLHVLQAPLEEMRSQDGRTLLVGTFLLWRVGSAQAFHEKLGGDEAAERLLTTLLRDAQAAAIGEVRFDQLVSAEAEALRHDQVEAAMRTRIRASLAKTDYGVEVETVGIRRLGLPAEATVAVFARMREDRKKAAEVVLAAGRAEAGRIRADAQEARETLLAAARAEARATLGKAEQEAAEHYKVLGQDPELAVFLKEVEALRKVFDERTTLVFDPTLPPFDLLKGARPKRPAEAPR